MKLFKKVFFGAMLAIPLQSEDGWQVLQYGSIPANKVTFSKSGLDVEVVKSASPIIYPLKNKKNVSEVFVKGKITGKLKFDGASQGEKGADDYIFRLGLVVSGDKTLSGPKSWFAPKWIKKLFSLAPKDQGIDHIYFLNVGADASHKGRVRKHPLSDLLVEEVVLVKNNSGDFEIKHKLKKPLEVVALWLALDGDDLGAEFSVNLNKIELRKP